MEETQKRFNDELIWEDLDHCCLSESVCGCCKGEACAIGCAKQFIREYQATPEKEAANRIGRVPAEDYKSYCDIELETGIAHVLRECRNCKENHLEGCILNAIRNCYEIPLFGDTKPYEGSSFQYVMQIKDEFPEKSVRIADIYVNRQN